MSADEVLRQHPALYQWLLDRVKPERDHNNRASYRLKWWLFGEPRGRLRAALQQIGRVIITPETSKHRVFAFEELPFCPDHSLYALATTDALVLGVLSSTAHAAWALVSGSTLEDRPRWRNLQCFLPFPFPSGDTGLTPALTQRIRSLAEQIDAHRKARQAAHESVTLTGLYNVLEKLRSGEPFTAKDKLIHEQGLVSVLKSLHDELDAAVLAAYGWSDLLLPHAGAAARAAMTDSLLERLVALNARRAAEEAAGTVRWLRPDFQQRPQAGEQVAMDVTTDAAPQAALPIVAGPLVKRAWPGGLPEQIKAVAEVLAASPLPLSLADLETRFTARGRWRERLPTIIDTLEALGRARSVAGESKAWQAA